MTTTAVSTTKTVNVAGIGPVELTVEERGDGQPFLLLHGGAVRSQSPRSPSCSPKRAATGYSRPRIRASAAHRGRTS